MSALAGVRVLELTQVMAGPFCGQVLADMGADVIKVEPPERRRRRRRWLPHAGEDSRGVPRRQPQQALDRARPQDDARERARFAASLRAPTSCSRTSAPGSRRASALDDETLRAVNPRLVYASISGFGQTGPYAQRPGYDLIAQGLAGVMSVTGEPGGDPVKCGVPVSDLASGLFCAVAILSALHARERTGRGQSIDTSLFEGAPAMSVWESAELWATGRVPAKLGSAHRLLAPYQALRTADGHITVGGNTQALFERLCAVIGRPELPGDARFATNDARMGNVAALVAELEAALRARSTDEWVAALVEGGVPCGPIHDYAQVFADEHTQAREMEVTVEHPVEGTIRALGIPAKLSDTPGAVRRPAPLLGEHTAEVLLEAGLSHGEIEAVSRAGDEARP